MKSNETCTFNGAIVGNGQNTWAGRQLNYSILHQITATAQETITAAGTVQGDATALIETPLSIVTTVASGTGVRMAALIAAAGGTIKIIKNLGANTLNVFPASGDKFINVAGTDVGANNAITLAAGAGGVFWGFNDGTTWLQII